MEPLRPGECRHWVTWDRPVTTQGDNGEFVEDFVRAFRLLSKIEPISGRERLTGNQPIAEGTTRIRCFWSPQGESINAKWRGRHGSIIYNVAGPPSHIEFARREIEIIATHGLNAG